MKEELEPSTVAKFATTTRYGAMEGKTQTHLTEYNSLDMIFSVGCSVKSKRGVEFRRWENNVLRQYIMQGLPKTVNGGTHGLNEKKGALYEAR